VAFLAGGRLTDEDAFALSKLARTVFGTNDLDHRPASVDGALAAERTMAASMPVSYGDVERAKAIVVVGLDAREELPILHLRIRKAVRRSGAKVYVVHPRRTALADVAEHLPCLPGREADVLGHMERPFSDTDADRAGEVVREAGADAVVLCGPRTVETAEAVEAARRLASAVGGRFALLSRRAGDRGALRAGVHPALLPGGRRVADATERSDVESGWGPLSGEAGRDTRGILEAAAARELDVLFLIGTDPLTDVPDRDLVDRALENVPFLVVQDISVRGYEAYADAVLPAAAFLEKDGHLTDWEGRGQRIRPVRPAPGISRPDWQIFQELSEAMGKDMGFHSLDDLHGELGSLLESTSVPDRPAGGEAARGSPEGTPSVTGGDPSDAKGLVLFTYPLLVDEGRLSEGADELKAALEEEAFVEVHPEDAARLGLEDGGRARVRTDAGETELPVRVSDGIVEGVAFVPWNQPGLRANTLLSGTTTTTATVEAVGGAEEGAA
jgi:NADH-quinone oxidoreductase subunit G